MALYYSLVFGLLVFEMVLFLILSLPLPRRVRKPLLTTISKPFHLKEVQIAIKCVLAFILILFIDAVNRVLQIKLELSPLVQRQQYQESHEGGLLPSALAPPPMGASLLSTNPEVQARKFYAERNMYLCGFTLFLTLIVNRTYALVHELLVLKDEATKAETTNTDSQEVEDLKKSIAEKDESLDILKDQAASLSKDYDEVSVKK